MSEIEVETKDFDAAVSFVGTVPPKTSKFIHGLEFVCFDGDRVYGYDDICCLETKNPVPDLDGIGIDVRVVQFLRSYAGKTLSISIEDNFVQIGGKRTKARLPVLARESFLFDRAEFKGKCIARAEVSSKEFVDALSLCSLVAGRQPSNLITCGVLVDCSKKELSVRGVSDEVIARVTLTAKSKTSASLLLPLQVAEHAPSLARRGGSLVVCVQKDKALMEVAQDRLYIRAMNVARKELLEAIENIDALLGRKEELPSLLPKRFLMVDSQLSAIFGSSETDVCLKVSKHRLSVLSEDGSATYSAVFRVSGAEANAEYVVSKQALTTALSAMNKVGVDAVGVAFEASALVFGNGPIRIALATKAG